MTADIARRRKICLRIDGRANHRRDIAQREVPLVVEARQQRRPRLPHARFLMTSEADSALREIVIFEPGRRLKGSMAGDARKLLRQLQVQLMRKRPLGSGRARDQNQKDNSHFPL